MNQVYKKAYTELLEIIKYLPVDEYNKIPKEKIEFYEKNKDFSYNFNYNPYKTLNEQSVLRQTKVLIVNLFKEIKATEEQKDKLNRILIKNEQDYQNIAKEKYSYDNLFKKNQKDDKTVNKKDQKNSTDMTIYKETIFTKIYSFLKKLLNKS